ncbi:hypothetical protein AEAC466_21625 [Asticcacaulis sp. AC466]|nr:hypothetical protein AEAC466_21625 [Asticcacaulis sp. AC466]
MKVSAFTLLLFFISVALVMASLIGYFGIAPQLREYHYWLMTGGFAVLALGIIFKGQPQ